jgi:hypothetical protein
MYKFWSFTFQGVSAMDLYVRALFIGASVACLVIGFWLIRKNWKQCFASVVVNKTVSFREHLDLTLRVFVARGLTVTGFGMMWTGPLLGYVGFYGN